MIKMPVRTLSFAVTDSFVEALDKAVTRHRRANADRNCSRASFIREAINRAVDDADTAASPEIRIRSRPTSVKPVAL